MRITIAALLGAALLAGCSPVDNSGFGNLGAGGGTAMRSLSLHVKGAGAIRSSSPSFECKSQCTQPLPAGARVQLGAVPDAGSTFAGWDGACSGTGDCALTLGQDADVTANFHALPPPPPGSVRISVQFTGAGSGTVSSTPAGIACPGTCAMTVQSGTAVSMSATPDARSKFVGFGGGCAGTSCSLTASGNTTVYANFDTNAPPPPPADSCKGIAAPDAVAMQQFVYPVGRYHYNCQAGTGDAAGSLALPMTLSDANAHGSTFEFVSTSGGSVNEQSIATESPHVAPQPGGILVWGDPGHLYPFMPAVRVSSFASGGSPNGTQTFSADRLAAASDPAGGLLLAGDLATGERAPSLSHAAAMYVPAGRRWGPVALASSGAAFGAGVDLLGRSLVITGGSDKLGAGTISGQWFDKSGAPLTDEFLLVSNFTPAASTWFEADPLIGGGLLVRRMDFDAVAHSTALVTVASGTTAVQAAPSWATSRPDRFQIVRGGKAYAAIPYAQVNVACSQRLELLAPDGSSCGAADYPIASGNCTTADLAVGLDGTVIQGLPGSMETTNPVQLTHTCTWRYWPAAVK